MRAADASRPFTDPPLAHRAAAMALSHLNPIVGWALAAAALAAGFAGYGWPGALLALSVVVFWLVLQFSRSLRVLRAAGGQPIGSCASALMLQTKLRPGMSMQQVIALTRSLGQSQPGDPDTFVWRDAGGDEVQVELRRGRLHRAVLVRAEAAPGAQP